MADATVFFSKKISAILDDAEQTELVRQISEKVETYLKVKTYSNLASSPVSGFEVSVNLYDVGNITGVQSDFLAWQIKALVIAFVLLKNLFLTPKQVRVTTQLRAVN